MAMISRRTFACLCVAGLAACSPDRLGVDDDGELEHYSEGFSELYRQRSKSVDILIVLDNSSSMAEEQALLANNLGSFIEVLEAEDVNADYRIAITTTDAGHPGCMSSTPERGAFMLTSCTSRQGQFVTDGEAGPADVRAVACTDSCSLDAADLAISATTTDEDPIPKPRPWLERNFDDRTNLPEGVEMADALRCFGPQGVAGCDFESPLEAMRLALLRAKDPTDPAYGFLRKDAKLFVLIITDEDDCSAAPDAEAIFTADATSAACWNAGVTCIGDPSGYDSCEATNEDLAGNEGVADQDAVLQPLRRYVELFDEIMIDKRALDPTQRPIIAIVAGVGSNGSLHFGEVGETDPEFQQTFGIGPGCTAPTGVPNHPIRATPPVRLHALQQAIESHTLYSVCEDSWAPALEYFGWSGPQIRPACFTHCALDTDPTTITVEPDCIVEQHLPDSDQSEHIPECVRDEHGYLIDPETHDYQPPSDADTCYAQLTDDMQQTPNTADDMAPECTDRNFNLEFKVSRRPGHYFPGGSRITATCLLANQPSLTCPGLED
jgi:hypothetical protein